MRRAFAMSGLATLWLFAWLSMLAPPASATVTGPCTASIGGVDVTSGHATPSTAVRLPAGEEIPVAGTARGRVTDLSYTVHLVGADVQVGSVVISGDGLSWSGTVDLADFSQATVGLFEVTADVQTETGDCSGVAYVCIEGRSPLTTAAGAGATAMGIGGFILLALALTRAGRMGGLRAGAQGFGGGAAAGVGGAVLLQQYCVVPLTAASVIAVPIAIGAAGALGASLLRMARASARGPAPAGRQRAGGGPSPVGPQGAGGGPVPVGPQGAGGGPAPVGPQGAGGGPAPVGPQGGLPEPPPPPPPEGGVLFPPVIPLAGEERECPVCGTPNARDRESCSNCGTRLGT